jgi:hypothetical protein
MEEAPEIGKESLNSPRANGMNELPIVWDIIQQKATVIWWLIL